MHTSKVVVRRLGHPVMSSAARRCRDSGPGDMLARQPAQRQSVGRPDRGKQMLHWSAYQLAPRRAALSKNRGSSRYTSLSVARATSWVASPLNRVCVDDCSAIIIWFVS